MPEITKAFAVYFQVFHFELKNIKLNSTVGD